MSCQPHEVLFVAGSASDVPGAQAVGMPVFWPNRMALPATDGRVRPEWTSETLEPLPALASGRTDLPV